MKAELKEAGPAARQGEKTSSRGKLKLFFGYASGVGTTRAMLEEAHALKQAGADVVAGCMEPHTIAQTLALLEGMECLSPQGDGPPEELDVAAALLRRPEYLLVDGLVREDGTEYGRARRYDSVEELLAVGIHVFATLTVYQLESMSKAADDITGSIIWECVPDRVFDSADRICFVDSSPEDFMKRLHLENTPQRREMLTALRELALRRMADRVGKEEKKNRTREHVLVCITGSSSDLAVIREAARLAEAFHADFTALLVEASRSREPPDKRREGLHTCLKLVEQMNARTVTVYGKDFLLQAAEYARAGGVTRLVIGCGGGGYRRRVQNISGRLSRLAPGLDLHFVADREEKRERVPFSPPKFPKIHAPDVTVTAAVMAACTFVCFVCAHIGLGEANIILVYTLGVLVVSTLTGGYLYSLAATAISLLAFHYYFAFPIFSLRSCGPEDMFTFCIMLISGLITSRLTMRVQEQTRASAMKSHQTEMLLETSKKLQRAENMDEILCVSCAQLELLLGRPVAIYPAEEGVLQIPNVLPDGSRESAQGRSAAQFAFQNGRPAGISTEFLAHADGLYMPVRSARQVFAVARVRMEQGGELPLFERSLLSAILTEISSAMEKYCLNEARERMGREAEKERLRANLLHAVSHDLRTPLTSISGSASILIDKAQEMDAATRNRLCEDIYDDSLWLISLVENLLSATRMEDGTMHMQMESELLTDIIAEAISHANRQISAYSLRVDTPDDMLMVKADARMLVQVVINLLNNAIAYTPPGSQIIVSVRRKGKTAVVEVCDNGSGIREEDKAKLFDMFFTSRNPMGDNRRGLGLGLFLCKSIIGAHGGTIYVRDNQPHGTIVGFTLPVEEVSVNESDNSGY